MMEGRVPSIPTNDIPYSSPGYKPKKMNLQANLHHNKNMNLFDSEGYRRENDVHESVLGHPSQLGSYDPIQDIMSNDGQQLRR